MSEGKSSTRPPRGDQPRPAEQRPASRPGRPQCPGPVGILNSPMPHSDAVCPPDVATSSQALTTGDLILLVALSPRSTGAVSGPTDHGPRSPCPVWPQALRPERRRRDC